MSAAKIAASLRSTGWTATLAPPHTSIARRAAAVRGLQAQHRYCPVARDLIVRFSGERLARRRGHEGLKWVEPTSCLLLDGWPLSGAEWSTPIASENGSVGWEAAHCSSA